VRDCRDAACCQRSGPAPNESGLGGANSWPVQMLPGAVGKAQPGTQLQPALNPQASSATRAGEHQLVLDAAGTLPAASQTPKKQPPGIAVPTGTPSSAVTASQQKNQSTCMGVHTPQRLNAQAAVASSLQTGTAAAELAAGIPQQPAAVGGAAGGVATSGDDGPAAHMPHPLAATAQLPRSRRATCHARAQVCSMHAACRRSVATACMCLQ
jgi:hypothetical protein